MATLTLNKIVVASSIGNAMRQDIKKNNTKYDLVYISGTTVKETILRNVNQQLCYATKANLKKTSNYKSGRLEVRLSK